MYVYHAFVSRNKKCRAARWTSGTIKGIFAHLCTRYELIPVSDR